MIPSDNQHPTPPVLPDPEVVEASWPTAERWPLSRAADFLGLEAERAELFATWREWNALRETPAPIIGVMGLLNSGKSSLVRGFLSKLGGRRVLAGIPELAATQRFVFWLPASWRAEKAVWRAFQGELEAVFGEQWEWLDENPEKAHLQYRAEGQRLEKFPVPLVAVDPKLDALGFGLLDCPDFERPHEGVPGHDTARVRREFIAKAARLMSAAVIVMERDKLASEQAGLLAGPKFGLDQKPRFLFINKIRPSHGVTGCLSDELIQERMRQFQTRELFAAYDFEMHSAANLTPVPPDTLEWPEGTPVVFQVAPDEADNQPRAIGPERFLHARMAQLKPAELWERQRHAKKAEILRRVDELEKQLARTVAERGERIGKIRADLIRFIRSRVTREERLAVPLTAETGRKLVAAILASAPWYAKPSMLMFRGFKIAQDWIKSTSDNIKTLAHGIREPTEPLRRQAERVRENLRESGEADLLDLDDWVEWSLPCRFLPEDVDPKEVRACWREIMNYAARTQVNFGVGELKPFARQVWREISVVKKIGFSACGPLVMTGSLVALFLFPVDGGTSTVLLTYSLESLLATLGLGATTKALAGGRLEKLLMEGAGLPVYRNLLAGAFDVFGLPRDLDQPVQEHFRNTGKITLHFALEKGEAPLPTRLPLLDGGVLAQPRGEGFQELRAAVEQAAAISSDPPETPA